MKCFYHNDMDGKCAGAIVYKYFLDILGETVECFPVNYNMYLPFDKVERNEKVIIVDFSFTLDDFRTLLKITDNVIWIDHHISAINKVKNTEIEKLSGIRENGKAGCELAWEYFFSNEPMPLMVTYLGRYDVWDFSKINEKKANALQAYCKTMNTEPDKYIWNLWLHLEYPVNTEIHSGLNLLEYRDAMWKEQRKNWAFETVFEGYNALACNTNNFTSNFFGCEINNYDIVMPFCFNGEIYTVSMYTNKDIDCSKLAEKYGGGGHKKAAGFICKKLPFEKEGMGE